ncbi:hypothetical protein BD626DRAFT_502342 [Schizophyllum amplum]|uniref:Uncharacterized protein n=1 Tax=Schizophyllum amplum TaxID=97359 RepID=A0A550C9A8_9AGAR|nr:hypothetical protein BD626DRAFT_502342 [Auriculariopsis ampla]
MVGRADRAHGGVRRSCAWWGAPILRIVGRADPAHCGARRLTAWSSVHWTGGLNVEL